MTALNTTAQHGAASQDFRRGMLFGAGATALLAASMLAGAFAAGVGLSVPQVNGPAAPAVEAYPDLGLRSAPIVQAPAAEQYADFGLRSAPVVQAPAVEQYVDFGLRSTYASEALKWAGPRMPHMTIDRNERINESNPHINGPVQAW